MTTRSNLPATYSYHDNIIDPALPAPSGRWGETPGDTLRTDTEHVALSLKNLNARTSQTKAMAALIESRISLARVMTDLSALAEICAAHFIKGRRQRASDVIVHDLKCELQETHVRTSVAIAKRHQAAFPLPEKSPPTPARRQRTLSPAQVDELVGMLGEVPDHTRETLRQLMEARVQEDGS